jgi:hypothetical protein
MEGYIERGMEEGDRAREEWNKGKKQRDKVE